MFEPVCDITEFIFEKIAGVCDILSTVVLRIWNSCMTSLLKLRAYQEVANLMFWKVLYKHAPSYHDEESIVIVGSENVAHMHYLDIDI